MDIPDGAAPSARRKNACMRNHVFELKATPVGGSRDPCSYGSKCIFDHEWKKWPKAALLDQVERCNSKQLSAPVKKLLVAALKASGEIV